MCLRNDSSIPKGGWIMILKKKAQEELVGFVVLIVIVMIIFLIFLGISLRKEQNIYKESSDVKMFLESVTEYTSDCAIVSEPNYYSIKDLLAACYTDSNDNCVSRENVCQALNKTLSSLIESSWRIGEDRPIKGYIFNSTYSENITSEGAQQILAITKGNCSSGIFVGSAPFFPYNRGVVIYSLNLCY